jgi:hypothetical protein
LGESQKKKIFGGIKMNKKIWGALLLVIILGIMLPNVFAEDTNIVDTNTQEEIKAFTVPHGAEVRLLQLEKNIERNVLIGAKVIEVIEKNHSEKDVNEAQTKLDELEALSETVKAYDTNGKDNNKLVTDFVAMKKQAITITQEFRQATAGILTAEDKKEVRDAVKNLDKNELKNINQAIKQAVKEHNAERIQAMLQMMGVSNPELIQSIIDGNATKQEVKEAIREAYKDLNKEQQKEIWSEIKEKTTKRIVAEKQLIQQAKKDGMKRFLEIEAQRIQRLSDWLEKRANDANEQGYEQRAERIQKWSDRVQEISNKIKDKNGRR